MPARSDFDPRAVPRLLPNIALVEVPDDPNEARFRVAGTALREIYAGEVTGRQLNHVYDGPAAEYWRRVHDAVLEDGVPLQGVMRGPAEGREHVVMFWLRLPLSGSGSHARFMLCYDRAAQMPEELPEGSLLAPRFSAPYAAVPDLAKQAYG